MTTCIQQFFSKLKCSNHPQENIVQLCVSSQCPQSNRVCCLECVDEHHMGHDHTLISHHKFSKLMIEFHAVLREKQALNEKSLTILKNNQAEVNAHIDQYYKHIKESLVKENELTSYEEFEQIDLKNVQGQQIKKRLNEIIDNHSWMLQINCKNNHNEQRQTGNLEIQAFRSKYTKLQNRLRMINETCEEQIKQILQRRLKEVKKLFHLFDQIKYNLEDDGKRLEEVTYSMTKINVQESPMKQERLDDSDKRKVKADFDFLGNLAGGQ